MPNWSESMGRTYEYYIVDPRTWKDKTKLDKVKSCTINRDSSVETLGSASFELAETLGECYVRVYLITIQNGVKERFSLGTFQIQTPSVTFDGMMKDTSVDAYTPLLELKENPPPLGYSMLKDTNIMDSAYRLVREQARAPVVKTECSTKLYCDFVANTDDTWLSYTKDLIANAKYEFGLDEVGRILFLPKQDTASLQPVWTFNDDNSSILYPEVTIKHDLYGIPNVVEVVYSNGGDYFHARVVNDDSNSPISTVNRGREILYRETNPSLSGNPTEGFIEEYAENLLKELSSIEYTLTYSHGYCPVRLGDCVRLNYNRAGLRDVKAKVTNQSIKCDSACAVTETAVFTKKLWR